MELPRTLHGQLYLLAYDRKSRRFDYESGGGYHPVRRFEFALRSAMLTDLYLSGYIEDRHGEACRVLSRHDDPLLHAALNRAGGRAWPQLIARGGPVCRQVHDQLASDGWVRGQHRRMMGRLPGRCEVYDRDLVGGLTQRVTDTLRDVIADRPVDPRLLAVGLIATQAQLRVVSAFLDCTYDRNRLHEMTSAAIEPICALRREMLDYLTSRVGGYGGGI